MWKSYNLRLLLILYVGFFPSYLEASNPVAVNEIERLGHHYSRVDSYYAVREMVDLLLSAGVPAEDILVLSDWDNVVNGPGAWEQKNYDGSYALPETKRMLLEHEVDHQLRDPHVLDTQNYIIEKLITLLIVTARPPVVDSHLPEMAGIPHLMDIRFDHNQDLVHHEAISAKIKHTLNQTDNDVIMQKAKHKVSVMREKSGVNLSGQNGLDKSFVHQVGDFKIVHHDGFSFVGHEKGPSTLALNELLNLHGKKHKIIIDDSPRALNSYISVLEQLSGKVYFLHYPIPGR